MNRLKKLDYPRSFPDATHCSLRSAVWSNDPLLIDASRLTLPRLLQQTGYKTACIGKWHLGFGSPNSRGWDNVKGPDYNLPLRPGPMEVGFDYFFGIPHVGQLPHVYIENHHVLGLKNQRLAPDSTRLANSSDQRQLPLRGPKDITIAVTH